MFFLASAWDRVVIAGTVNNSQFHDSGFQEFQRVQRTRPLWWVGTGKGDRAWPRLLHRRCAVWPKRANACGSGRTRSLSSTSCCRVRATVCADAGIQGGGDPAVTPIFAGIGSIGLQQDARPNQLTCTVFALVDQRVEPFTLLVVELRCHDVLLHASLPRGHDASPSLRSHRSRGSHPKSTT